MMLELNDLRIFVAVADTGSISRAAAQLNYVQSNVSARIKLMEERLGVSLFNRMSRGVTLSVSGKMLHDYAVRILALTREAELMLMEKEIPSGRFTIGAMETTAAVRLPGILAEYHRTFPEVDLHIVTGTTEELVNGVLKYSLDAAFVAGEVEHPDLLTIPVFQEELVLATGKDTSIENDRKRTVIVFRQGCSYRAKFEGWLRDSGYIPYQVMEFGTIDGILGCVRAGMGMTVLPRTIFKDDSDLTFHSLPASVARVDTMLVVRKDVVQTKAITFFILTTVRTIKESQ
jgi:DNA-binding transcriptional LysR family regulator